MPFIKNVRRVNWDDTFCDSNFAEYINLNEFNRIEVYDKRIKFVMPGLHGSSYIKDFESEKSKEKFVKKYLKNNSIEKDIQEIKEMIKYMTGSQVYTEANEDFIAQQKIDGKNL